MSPIFILTALFIFHFLPTSSAVADANDAAVMQILAKSISADVALNWSTSDPCILWTGVQCYNGKITAIQLHDGKKLSGSLPPQIRTLTSLVRLEFPSSNISGPLPSLKGLSSLQAMYLNDNSFTSVPDDFFDGLTSLREVYMDRNPFKQWEIPAGLSGSASLVNFSASSANVAGALPDFFLRFAALDTVNLALNDFSGHGLPRSLENSSVRVLWLNGCNMMGGIDVISRMNSLEEISLQNNDFTGPIPDFPKNCVLQKLNLRDNKLTGIVPSSLASLQSLKTVNLTNNLLQGQQPKFSDGVALDMNNVTERFCLPTYHPCDERVTILLKIVSYFGYPYNLAVSWKDNNPCAGWMGIICDPSGNITRVDFPKMNLTGSISQDFIKLGSLQKLNLSNNKIAGTIPPDLVNLKQLTLLDVSNNDLSGFVPNFSDKVQVITSGNPKIGKELPPPDQNTPSLTTDGRKNVGVIIGSIIGVIVVITIAIIVTVYYKKKKRLKFIAYQLPSTVIHPQCSGSNADQLQMSAAGLNGGNGTGQTYHGPVNVQVIGEPVNLAISIQVLRDATNNFSGENILGRGGFGTVYKGVYRDGKIVAVKRMESDAIGSTGLNEFKSEISILTKVRHRHLVSLLGYCLEDNEKILVYEYMSQGTLSQHLFDWAKCSAKSLDWSIRLSISLDVARGVEYLHSLMNESFIHRDLKPSNILLGDDMRAKVADFGLVRLAPEGKNVSVATRLAGTFGYLAPEYAVTGRVTAKSDVFSYGVILMELITGKRALDESIPDENSHLVTWFRRVLLDVDNLSKLVDPSIDIGNAETYASVKTVSELAGHCCARDPHSRPDMSHAVSTLTSIVEKWKPSNDPIENMYDFGHDVPRSHENLSQIGNSPFSEDTDISILPPFKNDASGR